MTKSALAALILECAPLISPDTMLGIVMQESKGNPLAINLNYVSTFPETKKEATELLNQAIKESKPFAAGLGQIWHTNFEWLGLNNSNVFDPCTNLKAAQTVLAGNYENELSKGKIPQEALKAAISQYYSGNSWEGWEDGYTQGVIKKAAHAVPSVSILSIETPITSSITPNSISDSLIADIQETLATNGTNTDQNTMSIPSEENNDTKNGFSKNNVDSYWSDSRNGFK